MSAGGAGARRGRVIDFARPFSASQRRRALPLPQPQREELRRVGGLGHGRGHGEEGRRVGGLGGRRVDTSASYRNQRGVGQAINAHRSVNRSDVFVTSKVGPYLAMGYDEVKEQVATMLDAGGLGTYVDLVLVRYRSSRLRSAVTVLLFSPSRLLSRPPAL